MDRVQITDKQIDDAIERVDWMLGMSLKEKGHGTFASTHEILGMATEEYNELKEAVHNKDYGNIEEEIIDLAVGCVFALACIRARTLDW
jgi:hypothetical protein